MTITFLNTQKIKTMEKILITPPAGYKIVETNQYQVGMLPKATVLAS